jgi:hypothetical protein
MMEVAVMIYGVLSESFTALSADAPPVGYCFFRVTFPPLGS